MKRTAGLRRTKRLKPVSRKVRQGKRAYDAVYAAVDARSGGRCEVSVGGGIWVCTLRATDHHHTRKPRRSFHAPEWIVHLCHTHHLMCERAYQAGRMTAIPDGRGSFRFTFLVARDKFAARALGA